MTIQHQIAEEAKKLRGPIVIFGAGGFIGANLTLQLLAHRNDVYAVTSKPFVPWRLEAVQKNILHCDITQKDQLEKLFDDYGFKTVFDLAAYGAYSYQDNAEKIYQTNFNGLLNLLEIATKFHIHAIVHAGSSSEYGLNCEAPNETDEMLPNSHYAVSKVAAAHLIKFYGIIKEVPVVNLRYYSIYGPYEDPDRLVPKLVSKGMEGTYPPLVQPEVSRDFVYIDDAVLATILSANANFIHVRGKSINIASNIKTTVKEIAAAIKDIFSLHTEPTWGNMPNRKWDLKDWYGKADLAKELLGWENKTPLKEGLQQTYQWQKDFAYPLYEKKIVQDKIRYKIAAVIACYKDAQAIPVMHQRLTETFKKIGCNYEIIFVNDCSPDNTSEVLQQIVNGDDHVIAIEHSRNFGSQSAFLSGMEISTSDAVVLLDGDLQDPPELIEEFARQWEQGYDVVYGRRIKREGNQTLVRFYKLFYRLFRNVSYVPIPLDAGDFSLMDKKVVNELIKMPETDQFLRGLRAWVGFKQTGVDYVRPERMFGTTTNNWRKNIGWARKAIFSFSYVPLEFLTYLGITLTTLSFIAILVQIILYFTLPETPHGVTTIICLVLFFGGITMLGLGILGEYQAKIIEEVKRRPKFIRKNIFRKQV